MVPSKAVERNAERLAERLEQQRGHVEVTESDENQTSTFVQSNGQTEQNDAPDTTVNGLTNGATKEETNAQNGTSPDK